MVRLHIVPIFSFLAKMLSFQLRDDSIFARNENIGKICKRTITWTYFRLVVKKYWKSLCDTFFVVHLDRLNLSPRLTSWCDFANLTLSTFSWCTVPKYAWFLTCSWHQKNETTNSPIHQLTNLKCWKMSFKAFFKQGLKCFLK